MTDEPTHLDLFSGMKTRYCIECGTPFEASNGKHKHCSERCSNLTGKRRAITYKPLFESGRFCRQCGKHFDIPKGSGANNKWHCSASCALKSARESRLKFWKRPGAVEARKTYNLRHRVKVGPDGNLKRFYRLHPEAPRECQSCGESRVLDVAHKPSHRRNGAWRSVKNTKWPDFVWVLCPTCHALLDRMHYPPSELGLSEEVMPNA